MIHHFKVLVSLDDFMKLIWINIGFTMHAWFMDSWCDNGFHGKLRFYWHVLVNWLMRSLGQWSPNYDHDHVAKGSTIVKVASVSYYCWLSVLYRSWWWKILHKHGNHWAIMVHHMNELNANTKEGDLVWIMIWYKNPLVVPIKATTMALERKWIFGNPHEKF